MTRCWQPDCPYPAADGHYVCWLCLDIIERDRVAMRRREGPLMETLLRVAAATEAQERRVMQAEDDRIAAERAEVEAFKRAFVRGADVAREAEA